jgi:hypothetical protein
MTFFQRLEGVFFNPRPTLTAVAEKPVWVDMLILLLIALVAFSVVVTPYATHDQLELTKDSTRLKERLGEERFNAYVQGLENPSQASRIIRTFVGAPVYFVVALLLQALVLIILGRFFSTQGTFRQVFASLVHAHAVNVLLGNAVRLVLILMRKSVVQTSTSLALLFPRIEVTSTAYVVLTQIDFFQLWLFGILAYGLSAVFKIDLKKALFLSYTLWVLKAVLNIAFGLFGMSQLR